MVAQLGVAGEDSHGILPAVDFVGIRRVGQPISQDLLSGQRVRPARPMVDAATIEQIKILGNCPVPLVNLDEGDRHLVPIAKVSSQLITLQMATHPFHHKLAT